MIIPILTVNYIRKNDIDNKGIMTRDTASFDLNLEIQLKRPGTRWDSFWGCSSVDTLEISYHSFNKALLTALEALYGKKNKATKAIKQTFTCYWETLNKLIYIFDRDGVNDTLLLHILGRWLNKWYQNTSQIPLLHRIA